MRGPAAVCLILLVAASAPATRSPAEEPHPYSLAGELLVAAPELGDPNFRETVVYMLDHGDDGAMGLVVNRVLARGPLAALLADLGLESEVGEEVEITVHEGGPVERGRALVLHSDDYRSARTRTLRNGLAVTASTDILGDIAAGHGPRRSLLALGYAGWAPGQLERELADGAWIVVPADEALLFDAPADGKWRRALGRHGVDL
jgi:putative transcriptional regulator